jgi:hypothetical protein
MTPHKNYGVLGMNSVALRIATLAQHGYTERWFAGSLGLDGKGHSSMGNPFQFREGDRVRARTSGTVPAGTLGTIRQVLYSAPGMYFVDFDGFAPRRLMEARDLERVTDESEKAP